MYSAPRRQILIFSAKHNPLAITLLLRVRTRQESLAGTVSGEEGVKNTTNRSRSIPVTEKYRNTERVKHEKNPKSRFCNRPIECDNVSTVIFIYVHVIVYINIVKNTKDDG